MKYIFKFIEYINETNILSLATLILIIGYLRYLYNKKEEVEEYDQYLTGEVYGIIEEEYDVEDDTWEETDSCWGFFNSKFGSELIEDVARDYGISETLYDSMEEIVS